jgi:hypothetical protein
MVREEIKRAKKMIRWERFSYYFLCGIPQGILQEI